MLKKPGIQKKMILYQIGFIGIIISMLIIIFYQFVISSVREQTDKDHETIVSKTVTQFETLLYDMDKTALQVAANPEVVKTFSKIDKNMETNYFIEEPVVASEIIKLLNSYNFKQDGVARICLYNDYQDFVATATHAITVSGTQNFLKSNHIKQLDDYFKEGSSYVFYQGPKEDILSYGFKQDRKVFCVIREIKDYSSNSSKCGYVEVQELSDKIDELFKDLKKDSYALILDDKSSIVWSNGVSNDKEEKNLLDFIEEQNYKEGSYYDRQQHISFVAVDKTPFSILVSKDRNKNISQLFRFNTILILGVGLILVIAVITQIFIIRRLTKPLTELNRSIKRINLQNLRIDMEESQNSDELKNLQDSFNIMMEHLKESMDKQYIAETNELKSHLFALQSQMDPHFLHNILAIISIEAEANENNKIQNMCAKLCRMLRFTSSMGNGFCTVEQEIINAENYMILMKERYEECFEYDIDIPEELKEITIPKLIVQPICENSFQHAFKNKESLWKIKIRAYKEEQNWYIEIRDNGNGFEEHYLRKFEEMKASVNIGNVKENMEQISIGGLCIPNIFMRLELCYEDKFCCKLYNDVDGAVVLLGGEIRKS